METINEPKVYFDNDNKVVIETAENNLVLEQKQAKIVLLKLYSMFSDENTKRFFPDKEQKSKITKSMNV